MLKMTGSSIFAIGMIDEVAVNMDAVIPYYSTAEFDATFEDLDSLEVFSSESNSIAVDASEDNFISFPSNGIYLAGG